MARLKFILKSSIFNSKIRSFGDLLHLLYSNGLSFIGSQGGGDRLKVQGYFGEVEKPNFGDFWRRNPKIYQFSSYK